MSIVLVVITAFSLIVAQTPLGRRIDALAHAVLVDKPESRESLILEEPETNVERV